MKRKSIILLCLCGILLITGCQKKQNSQTINLDLLSEEMAADGQDWPQMELVSSKDSDAKELFSYLADFAYEKVEEYFFLYSTDSSRPGYEVAVVRLKSEEHVEELKLALRNHIDYRIRTFETYAPDQVAIMERAVIEVQGQYVALFVTEQNQELIHLFETARQKS